MLLRPFRVARRGIPDIRFAASGQAAHPLHFIALVV